LADPAISSAAITLLFVFLLTNSTNWHRPAPTPKPSPESCRQMGHFIFFSFYGIKTALFCIRCHYIAFVSEQLVHLLRYGGYEFKHFCYLSASFN
jgi:hypothetical protein